MRSRSILIVEDHELVAQGLKAMLEPAYRIAGIVHDGGEVLERVAVVRPDLVSLDLSLPGRSGMDVLMDLHREHPLLPVVVLTMHAESALAEMALGLGALAFVPKNARREELHAALTAAFAGHRYVSHLLTPQRTVRDPSRPSGFLALTPRQQAIVRLIGQGHTTQQIADELGSSYWTVHSHRKAIRHNLGLKSDWEMTRYSLLVCECDRNADIAVIDPTSP